MTEAEKMRRLVKAFYLAAVFLKEKVEAHGWRWSSNYLREHARCASHVRFTNSESPKILRALRKQHPELAKYIDIKPLKRRVWSKARAVGAEDAPRRRRAA